MGATPLATFSLVWFKLEMGLSHPAWEENLLEEDELFDMVKS